MSKVSVTYKAPQGGNKECELFGFKFADGKPVEIEANEANAFALEKLADNPLFSCSNSDAAADVGKAKAEAEQAEDDEASKGKSKKARW
jgi:hypothetical protein